MASTLPPDPYKALGVTKDAKLPEIRSAHRKLVLKCHPDKVQDAALKAIKQDEFQKVQQAYELLSDETRRQQYDDQVKLFELRKEMGRGNPTPRSNPFEYEVRTADPRPSTYPSKPTATSKPAPASSKPYERPVPRSYEDLYEREEPRPTARTSKSQEYERKPRSSRDDEKERLRRKQKDDEERAKWEKEAKRAHGEKSKSSKRDKERSSDKERKRASEEKYTRMTYVEEDSSDDYHVSSSRPRSSEKKMKERMEAEIRMREEQARAAEKVRKQQEEESERTRKLNRDKDFAAQYMQAARRKVQPQVEDDFEPARPQMRRAETFAAPPPSYNIRYATPTAAQRYSDEEDTPRRSSARTSSRRASEAPVSSRSRDVPKTSSKESRRSPPAESRREREAYIVEPPSPPPVKKPSLQSHKSAPPVVTASRKEPPTRSKTMQPQFSRSDSNQPPPLPRASTFQSGDRGRTANSSSKLKATHGYSSDSSSDSDSPIYTPAPKMRSPSPPRHRHAAHVAPEPTRYIIESGRSVPVASHRSELREDRYSDQRDRSESPRGGRHTEKTRAPVTRSGSRQAPRSSSHAQAYYPPDPPPPTVKPVVIPVRPKMSPREQPTYRGSSSKPAANYSEQVKFAPSYGPEHVVYNDTLRRASERNGYDNYPAVRGVRESVY